MTEQTIKRQQRTQRHIDRIVGQKKPLPAAFIKWGKRRLKAYLVYEPGKNEEAVCTRCGKVHKWKRKLKLNETKICPSCKAECVCKTPKKLPATMQQTFVYMQKIKDGILVRFVVFHRDYRLWPTPVDTTEENLMVSLEKGKRQWWLEKRKRLSYNPDPSWYLNNTKKWIKSYNGPNYKMEAYQSGCFGAIASYDHVKIYENNLSGLIKDTPLAYIDLEKILEYVNRRTRSYEKIYDFIEVYDKLCRFPQLESLWKIGFRQLCLEEIVSSTPDIKKRDKLHKSLGISKKLWNYLLKNKKFDIEKREIKRAAVIDRICPDKDVLFRVIRDFSEYELKKFFIDAKMNIGKTDKYYRRHHKNFLYKDYLNMAIELGYNLRDDFVSYPKDVQQAHDAAVAVRDEEINRKALKKAQEKDSDIMKIERKIRKRFSFEDDKFLIRPAKTNREIVKEGQVQHICVGNGYYADNMIKGKKYILLLRRKESPDVPFYTIEIDKDYRICQRHGKYNKQFEEVTEVDTFLNKFVEAMTNGEKHYAAQ